MNITPRTMCVAVCSLFVCFLIYFAWLRNPQTPDPSLPGEVVLTSAHTNLPMDTNSETRAPLPTAVLPPERTVPTDEIAGIGAVLRFDRESRTIRITDTVPNSPADQAGLAGLIVHKIDDVFTTDMKLDECVGRVRGPAGTIVRLELIDPDQNETNTVELTRATIRVRL